MTDLSVDINGLQLANPVMTASGTFGYGREYADLTDLNRLGAIIVKGISLKPSAGNPPPRIVETASGMLNAIGLENIGLEAFVRDKLPFLSTLSPRLLVNIYGRQVEEYAALAAELSGLEAVDGLEINISCPNVKAGGLSFGVDPEQAAAVVSAVRRQTRQHLTVKLTPNVTDVGLIARAVADAGADAVSLINTLAGMAVDIHTRRPRLSTVTGGLSGPAIKPVALKMVWETARKVSVPVIGIGGIMSAEDALEFLMAGAAAVQVGTANFVNPRVTLDIIAGIERFLEDNRLSAVTDIIGCLET
ncbi:MAG: dihydroorotate dehydrogenase [Desulfosudaceae bacterium]